MTTTMIEPKEASRFLQSYAKLFGAGAFAAPMAKELVDGSYQMDEWIEDGERLLLVSKTLTRESTRTDYIGRKFYLPPETTIITHLARTPGSKVPDLNGYDFVTAYLEDQGMTAAMKEQGRELVAVTMSASSEMKAIWGKPGFGHAYDPVDVRTFTQITAIPTVPIEEMIDEVNAINSWHDDFPYYSDGTWNAVSLRGYRPDDPTWGIKPSEMPKKWHKENPGAIDLTCDWTTLSAATPIIRNWVDNVPWMNGLERVRLFRMESKKGGGKLGRHSDIQDKSAGTRNGQLARFHLPLITHPDIRMTTWNLDGIRVSEHLVAGNLYYLDTRKPHAVNNDSPVDRVHLVIDVEVDEGVREVIRSGNEVL